MARGWRWLILGVLLGLVPSVALAAKKARDQGPAQAQVSAYRHNTFCETYKIKGGPVVLFGIDRTRPTTDDFDRREIGRARSRVVELLKEGWRVKIFTIRGDATESRLVFEDCLPGALVEGFLATLTAAPPSDTTVQDKHTKDFWAAFNSSIDAASAERVPRAKESAIMATLTAMTGDARGDVKALIVASDLIEGQLAYVIPDPAKPMDDFTIGEHLGSARRLNLMPSLGPSVLVEVFGVGLHDADPRRPLTIPTRESLVRLWESYFSLSGSRAVKIHR